MVENVNRLPEEENDLYPCRMSPEERRKRGYKDTALKFQEPLEITNQGAVRHSKLKASRTKRPKTPNADLDLDGTAVRGSATKLNFKRNTQHGSTAATLGRGASGRKDKGTSLKKDRLVVTNAAQVAKSYTDVEPFEDFVPYTRWNALRPDDLASPAQRPRPIYGVEGGEFERAGASRRSGNQMTQRQQSAREPDFLQPDNGMRRSAEMPASQRNGWGGQPAMQQYLDSDSQNIPSSFPSRRSENNAQQSQGISMDQRERLETRKIALAHMPDFNLIDAFRIFDVESRGSVTSN